MTELEKAARMALEALKETLLFCETFSNRWDGQTGAHPFGMVERARAAVPALTQALATTEPDFDGSVIVGHSKHRGGWFVFEEVSEGEFTPIKGPFSSRDEADQAMRDPHAPLIQPATPEPDVPETNFGNTTERKVEPVALSRIFDLICKAIDTADTLTMEGDYMLDSDDCIAVIRTMQAVLDVCGHTSPQVPEDAALLDYLDTLASRPAGSDLHCFGGRVVLYIRTGVGSQIQASGSGTARDAIRSAMLDAARKGE